MSKNYSGLATFKLQSSPPLLEIVMESPIVVSFSNSSSADASRYAASLQDAIRDAAPEVRTERVRDSDDSQDFGASLAIILGTASVTALAKGLANFLGSNGTAEIEIRRNGTVLVRKLQSRDVPQSLKEIFGKAE